VTTTVAPGSPVHGSAADPTGAAAAPRRVLLLSGSIGAGHHAAAAAVAEAVGAAWPGAEVVTGDVLAGMGRAAPRTFPGVYAMCVRALPWLYGLYYGLLLHVGVFRAGTRAVLGRWSARSIAPLLAAHRPDLVVATFPEGVAGLGHLRRTGRLPARAVVVPSDPAPQPLWCDADLDAVLVTTDLAARRVRRSAPGATVHVVRWPVVAAFHPPGPPCQESPPVGVLPSLDTECPQRDFPDIGHGRLRVLVAAGSLGFGDLPAIVGAVLAAGADAVVTTTDPHARARLDALAATHPGRVEVHRWIDDPATVTRGADVVVTTGGGASAFEALACARPLLVVDPIPGHGRDNARLLARAGLARYCAGPGDLTAALRTLADPDIHAARVAALRERPPGEDLAAALVGTHRVERMRPEDALFWHASTARVPQVLGARITITVGDDDTTDWPALVADRVRERAAGIALLARRLDDTGPLRWRGVTPDPHRHVDPVLHVGNDDAVTTAHVVGAPVDPRDIGWRLAVARTGPGEVSVLAAAHHCLGDGLAVTDALVRLLTDEAAGVPTGRRDGSDPAPADRARRAARRTLARRRLSGITALARAGGARAGALGDRSRGGVASTRLVSRIRDAAEVRALARALGTSTTVVVVTAVAEALAATGATTVRAMVPLTARLRADADLAGTGNRTAAVAVDLPITPGPVRDRVAAVAHALERGQARGQAEGSAAVLAALRRFPRPAQRLFARLTYGGRFFHLVVSVMPGVRRPLHIGGGLVAEVVPVLPLAEGVGVAIGAIAWGSTLGVGLAIDDAVLQGSDLPERVDAAWAALIREAGVAREEQTGHRRNVDPARRETAGPHGGVSR
jgi:diacylglycerol O-acyltransferase